jgi:TolB-like protein
LNRNAGKTEPSLALPDKPSIAVLPFNNMSGDASQEFFADGIAEDITTLLSRLPGFFVIARNSAFTYKGRAVDARQVASELGVRYVLEGSVRKAGQRARVTAQLIEAISGNHIWAEKYDCNVEDIFVVQDEITQGIYAALKTHLLLAEAEFAQRKPPQSLDAWGYTVRALVKWYYITPENLVDVVALARRAISLQPDYGPAHAIFRLRWGSGPTQRSATTLWRWAAKHWPKPARRSNSTATIRTCCSLLVRRIIFWACSKNHMVCLSALSN